MPLTQKIDAAIEVISHDRQSLKNQILLLSKTFANMNQEDLIENLQYLQTQLCIKVPSLTNNGTLKTSIIEEICHTMVSEYPRDKQIIVLHVFCGLIDLIQQENLRQSNKIIIRHTNSSTLSEEVIEKIDYFVTKYKDSPTILENSIHQIIPALITVDNFSFSEALQYFTKTLSKNCPQLLFNENTYIIKREIKDEILNSIQSNKEMVQSVAYALNDMVQIKAKKYFDSHLSAQVEYIINTLPDAPRIPTIIDANFMSNPPASQFDGFIQLKDVVSQMDEDELISFITYIRDVLEERNIIKIDPLEPSSMNFQTMKINMTAIFLQSSLNMMVGMDLSKASLVDAVINHKTDYLYQNQPSAVLDKYRNKTKAEKNIIELIETQKENFLSGTLSPGIFFGSIADDLSLQNSSAIKNIVGTFLQVIQTPTSPMVEVAHGLSYSSLQKILNAFSSHTLFDEEKQNIFENAFIRSSPTIESTTYLKKFQL